MKFKIIISFCLIYILLFNQVIAGVLFSEIFPNTEDDKNLEYIELFNSGNINLSLSGFVLKDKSDKEYFFGSGNILLAGEKKKYFRNDTKILLNNSDEELYLYDNSGNILDSYFYELTTKGEKIIIINNGVNGIIENSSGIIESFSGIIDTGTGIVESNIGIIENSSGILDTGLGNIETSSGIIESGIGIVENSSGIVEIFSGTIDVGTGIIEDNIGIGIVENSSGIVEIFSGTIDVGIGIIEDNIGIGNTLNLIFNFQNPSYILDKDKILKEYICDSEKDECKMNLDLRNSFTGSYNESDYECEIDFGFDGWLNGEEKKCNPNTIVFPKGEYDLKFKIIEKNNTGNIFTGGFILENKIEVEIIEKEIIKEVEVEKIVEKNTCSSSGIGFTYVNKIEIQKPEIIIQSGIDKEDKCKKEECSINLKYEGKDKLERCEWNFTGGLFKGDTNKKCNPGYVKYGLGNHKIILKVYEKGNKNNYKESVLNFTNIKKEKREKKNIEKEQSNIKSSNNEYLENNTGSIKMNNIVRNIKLGNVSINPIGKDENEYIEIINYSSGIINLNGCHLDDILIKGSKKYYFKNDFILDENEKIKLYKKDTKIILNNKTDEVNLICDGNIVDKIEWDFDIKEGYILNNSKLIIRDKIDNINKFLKAEKEKIKQDELLFKNNLNIVGNQINIISNESKVKTIFQPIIEIQGKIGTNKKLEKNKITCYKTCSINFDGSNSVGDIEEFIWDFGNGETFKGKNPGYIKYTKYGNYKVILKTITKIDEEKETSFLVEYFISSEKIKSKKEKLFILDSDSKINNSFQGMKEENIKLNNSGSGLFSDKNLNTGNNKKIEILLYLLIFLFSLNLVVMILKREKLL